MWEKNINHLLPETSIACSPTRDRTGTLSMCPDQDSNPQPFGVQDDAPANWATWPGKDHRF